MKILSALIVTVLVTLGLALSAAANVKEVICHPNNGAHLWSVVDVSKESSHFADDGTPKHTSHDGRTDVLSVNGLCPGEVTPTEPPTTTVPTITTPTSSSPTTEPTPTEPTETEPTTPTEPPGTTTVPTVPVTTSTTTTDSPPPATETTDTATLAPPVVSTRPPTHQDSPAPQVPTAVDAGIEGTATTLPDTGGVDMRLLALGLGLIGLSLVVFGALRLKRGAHL